MHGQQNVKICYIVSVTSNHYTYPSQVVTDLVAVGLST